MNKRDALKLMPGDQILLKHNLGGGVVTEVVTEERPDLPGRYPMIRYECGGFLMNCTYRVVDVVTKQLRSVT